MNKLTRRTFGKRILATGVLPLLPQRSHAQTEATALIPPAIAGYKPTAEERALTEKYLSTHEKNFSSLRERDLPNSLAPFFVVTSPTMGGVSGSDSH